MMPPRERYQDDQSFRMLVDVLYCAIERAEFTPTEIREAAMLAQIHYEELHSRSRWIEPRRDYVDALPEKE